MSFLSAIFALPLLVGFGQTSPHRPTDRMFWLLWRVRRASRAGFLSAPRSPEASGRCRPGAVVNDAGVCSGGTAARFRRVRPSQSNCWARVCLV